MGWGSGGAIFDAVADELIKAGYGQSPAEAKAAKLRVLPMLLRELQSADWDTEDESLDQYRTGHLADPVTVGVFYANGVGARLEATGDVPVAGEIIPDFEEMDWLLYCQGVDGCGRVGERRSLTAHGHNQVLADWALHERRCHGGTGRVDEWRKMREEP